MRIERRFLYRNRMGLRRETCPCNDQGWMGVRDYSRWVGRLCFRDDRDRRQFCHGFDCRWLGGWQDLRPDWQWFLSRFGGVDVVFAFEDRKHAQK